jgi:two-component system chemotaxis response regulator CheY
MKTLIVDDDVTFRLILSIYFSRYGECHLAENGKEAIERFRDAYVEEQPYDLILMDQVMPEIDGQAALLKIRSLEKAQELLSNNAVKIIMVTSVNDKKNITEAFKGLCNAYLLKPFTEEQLIKTLNALRLDLKKKITCFKTLIIEDDFTNRLLLHEILKKYGPTHIAINGEEALNAFSGALQQDEPYNLVCMDIKMTDMDWQTAIKQIHDIEVTKGIVSPNFTKIVIISATADLKNVSTTFSGLTDGYLAKPINNANLMLVLRKLCLIE